MRRAFVVAVLVAGCAVGPDFHRPEAPRVSHYTAGRAPDRTVDADGRAQTFTPGADVVEDWWRLFGSKAASAVVAAARANNESLTAARANLRQSNELLRAGYGVFFPQVDAQLGASYQRFSPARFGSSQPPTQFGLYTASGTVSYVIDIWGGERRQVEALSAGVDAQRYKLMGAQVMICANALDTLMARAAYLAQIEATEATVELQQEQLRITSAQATAGTVPYANVLALKTQVSATQALVPQLRQKVDQASHLISTLMGRPPSEAPQLDVRLADFALPRDLPVSLPSQLVRQRADVLVAEAELHAANAQIGVATAAMLPNITLSASGGANAKSPSNLFSADGVFWGVTGGLTAPIFHGGTLNHQRKAAVAARDAALATYRDTVLGAFQQVADTLRALEHDAEALHAQKEGVDSAEQALFLVQTNYRTGVANYLQVIIANQQYLQAKIAYLESVAQRLQDTVALYVALGGGWWNGKDSTAPVVSQPTGRNESRNSSQG